MQKELPGAPCDKQTVASRRQHGRCQVKSSSTQRAQERSPHPTTHENLTKKVHMGTKMKVELHSPSLSLEPSSLLHHERSGSCSMMATSTVTRNLAARSTGDDRETSQFMCDASAARGSQKCHPSTTKEQTQSTGDWDRQHCHFTPGPSCR